MIEFHKKAEYLKKGVKATFGIFIGYLFLGIAFGIIAYQKEFGIIYTSFLSIFLFSGAMSFVAIDLLLMPFDIVGACVLTIMVNLRYMFYSFGLLNLYKDFGYEKFYMIHTISDESYAILTSVAVPLDLQPKKFRLTVNALNHLYWILGCFIGSLIGSLMNFEIKGIEFAMTALFTTIVVDQFRNRDKRKLIITSLVIAMIFILLFKENFLLPSIIVSGLLLIIIDHIGGGIKNDFNSSND